MKKANNIHTLDTVKLISKYPVLNFFLGIFLCKHDYGWDSNIHGDEINMTGGKRSWWFCNKCGCSKAKKDLYEI